MNSARAITDRHKTILGCAECGYSAHPAALQYAHIDASTKRRTHGGKVVHPSDMIKPGASDCGARYSWESIKREISLCRVLCANCHAVESANQR